MKTVYYQSYGSPDVLQLRETEKPVPKPDEVLVKVYASTVNYGDIVARNFANIPLSEFNMPGFLMFFAKFSFGWRKPRINVLGSEFAGEIEAIGADVSKFKPGDQVFGYMGMNMGANAEFICMKESGMIGLKPSNFSYYESAALPYGGITALGILKKVQITPGQKVLVNGASGGIGSMALQLAKHYGAEVTGVCSTARMDYVKTLGADVVLDYTKGVVSQSTKQYDLIVDVLGRLKWADAKKLLTENGVLLLGSFKTGKLLLMLWTKLFSKQKVICAFSEEKQDYLKIIKDLAEKKALKVIIDSTFTMEKAADAHAHYERKANNGHVILTIN